MEKKTIILLSAKRCGSTAVFQMFQKHPDVSIGHQNKHVYRWEPNFWNLAVDAISGSPKQLVERLHISMPKLKLPTRWSEKAVFALWDQVLSRYGPVIFDKSPQYLGSRKALSLIRRYQQLANDVRIFAVVRDGRDAITSQHTLWKEGMKISVQERERLWLQKYRNLEKLQRDMYIPVFRYEDFAAAPSCYAPMIFEHCGLRNIKSTFRHVKKTNIGRYAVAKDHDVRRWRFDARFRSHLDNYGYDNPQRIDLRSIKNKRSLSKRLRSAKSRVYGFLLKGKPLK